MLWISESIYSAISISMQNVLNLLIVIFGTCKYIDLYLFDVTICVSNSERHCERWLRLFKLAIQQRTHVLLRAQCGLCVHSLFCAFAETFRFNREQSSLSLIQCGEIFHVCNFELVLRPQALLSGFLFVQGTFIFNNCVTINCFVLLDSDCFKLIILLYFCFVIFSVFSGNHLTTSLFLGDKSKSSYVLNVM